MLSAGAAQTGNLSQAIGRSEDLQNRLWSHAIATTEKERSPVTALYIQSLNEVIDLEKGSFE